jgi:hypothetical protein
MIEPVPKPEQARELCSRANFSLRGNRLSDKHSLSSKTEVLEQVRF